MAGSSEPTTWLLVHSPLLGPFSWTGVAKELRERGVTVLVPDLRSALKGGGAYAERQAELAAASAPESPVLLVGHSGAGPLLPAVAAALAERGARLTAAVFVDAGLPHPGRSRRSTLPEALAAHLDGLTIDGWLPPWPQWWAPEELAQLLPDPTSRVALVDDCHPLPIGLFEEPLPDGPVLTGGYVRLSETYADAADQAEQLGWPVIRLDVDHLALLTRPAELTERLIDAAAHASPAQNAARLHVRRFNEAVRSGEWREFADAFADDAVMRFTNVPVGPFVGRDAIARGYLEQPPDDTMTVQSVDETAPDTVRVRFRWDAGGDGTMRLRRRDGLIFDLAITFD